MRRASSIVAIALATLTTLDRADAQVTPQQTMDSAMKYLKSNSGTDRAFGIVTLGLLGKDAIGASKDIVVALYDSSPEVRKVAGQTLPMVNPAISQPVLTLARSDDRDAKAQAVKDLGKQGPDAIGAMPALMNTFDQTKGADKGQVLLAMAAVGSQDKEMTAKVAMWALKDPDPAVRAAALQALPKMADAKGQIATFLPLLAEMNQQSRLTAITALAGIGQNNPQVLKALEGLTNDKDKQVSEAATKAVGILKPRK